MKERREIDIVDGKMVFITPDLLQKRQESQERIKTSNKITSFQRKLKDWRNLGEVLDYIVTQKIPEEKNDSFA